MHHRVRSLPARRRRGGFLVLEAIIATGMLAAVTVFALVFLRRMEENLLRSRCEAHLGMVLTQHVELLRYVPYDALADAAANPTGNGFIRFGGGATGGSEIPYRVEVDYTPQPGATVRQDAAQLAVAVFWSPPNPTANQELVSRPGSERLFRRVALTRFRY